MGSEQQFVDCDKVDQGCNGGLMDNAFKFAEKNAICTEGSYPYKGRGGTCEASSCTVGVPNGDVKGFKDVTADNEQALMSAVQQQPVSIAIEADKSVFQLYKTGVLQGTCGASLDHGVFPSVMARTAVRTIGRLRTHGVLRGETKATSSSFAEREAL